VETLQIFGEILYLHRNTNEIYICNKKCDYAVKSFVIFWGMKLNFG